MSEYQKEMEDRVTNLENRLKSAENDIKERTEQVNEFFLYLLIFCCFTNEFLPPTFPLGIIISDLINILHNWR